MPHADVLPSREAIERALDTLRGTYLQQPPAYSAKRIDGTRSYKLARARARGGQHQAPASTSPTRHRAPAPVAVLPSAVRVTAHAIDLHDFDGETVTLRVDCSAGFYLRSLAHDLGVRLGTGAHLAALRRTRSGDFTLRDSVRSTRSSAIATTRLARFVPLAGMLRGFASVVLTPEGVRHACHGRDLGPADLAPESSMPADMPGIDGGIERRRTAGRAGSGCSIGTARCSVWPRPAASRVLHPSVVLV